MYFIFFTSYFFWIEKHIQILIMFLIMLFFSYSWIIYAHVYMQGRMIYPHVFTYRAIIDVSLGGKHLEECME